MKVRLQTPLVLHPERSGVIKLSLPTAAGWLTMLPRYCDGLVLIEPGLFSLFSPAEEVLASGGATLIKQGELVTITAQELVSGSVQELARLERSLRLRGQILESGLRALMGRMVTDFVLRLRELVRR